MSTILHDRIKYLCQKNGVTITKLESDLGFGNTSIKKWRNDVSPSVDKIVKVANYFNVSTDYLLGKSDTPLTASDILSDEDIISLQRARERMTITDREKMMQMLRIGFDYAFREDNE